MQAGNCQPATNTKTHTGCSLLTRSKMRSGQSSDGSKGGNPEAANGRKI